MKYCSDNLSPEQRTAAMRAVKSQNTSIEIAVRRLLRSIGQTGYRLHRQDIPGKPDIAWIGRKLAFFVHGCFWHGHDCRRGARVPATHTDYWLSKIQHNQLRDSSNLMRLQEAGWLAMVIWECELKQPDALIRRFLEFFWDAARKNS